MPWKKIFAGNAGLGRSLGIVAGRSAGQALHSLIIFFIALYAAIPLPASSANDPVGGGSVQVRLLPIMAPYRTSQGVRYEVIQVQLVLVGSTEGPSLSRTASIRQQVGCWMIPIVHEKIIMYLSQANLEAADFVGQRREVLATKLFGVAVATTDRGTYGGLILVDESTPELNPRSRTMSAQCR